MTEFNRSSLYVGLEVEINPQSDRTRKKLVTGRIKEILTTSETHPHGILVVIESGEKGRVKSVNADANTASTSRQKNDVSAHVNLRKLIDSGENHNVEFKSSALWSSKLTNEEIKEYKPASKELHKYGQNTSKIIIAKTVAGFLNTDGGTLIIGVFENKNSGQDEVIGIEPDCEKLKDSNVDGYRRMLVDLFKDYFAPSIFNHLNQHLTINFEEINSARVCGIIASPSDERVFASFKNEEHFYIRTDASTRELSGSAIVDYCDKRFPK